MLNLNGIIPFDLPSIDPGTAALDQLDFEETLDSDPDYLAFLLELEQGDIEAERAE